MKIVVIDGYTLNPGDLDWEHLSALGELTVYDRTPANQLVERLQDAEAVLVNKVKFDQDLLRKLPRLKYIGVTATGYNIIDIEAAHKQGVTVTNVPDYGTFAVAQHTFALILALSNQVHAHHADVQKDGWARSPDWCYAVSPITELYGKTLGIIGMGKIGAQVASIGHSMGMRIATLDSSRYSASHFAVEKIPQSDLLSIADVISLHCPLNAHTQNLVNQDFLRQMKKSGFLVNTSRGGLVVESDLVRALSEGWIQGAALDVLSEEPPVKHHRLTQLPNCIITPHIAWMAKEARIRLLTAATHNLASFLQGSPVNVIA